MTDRTFPKAFLFVAALSSVGVPQTVSSQPRMPVASMMEPLPSSTIPAWNTVGDAAADPPLLLAAADCSGAAAQAAADSGGKVLSVSSRQQGGRTVCVVTVLVPGSDGERPRKRTISIPQ